MVGQGGQCGHVIGEFDYRTGGHLTSLPLCLMVCFAQLRNVWARWRGIGAKKGISDLSESPSQTVSRNTRAKYCPQLFRLLSELLVPYNDAVAIQRQLEVKRVSALQVVVRD